MLGLVGANKIPVKAQDNYFWSSIMLFPFLIHMALQMGSCLSMAWRCVKILSCS